MNRRAFFARLQLFVKYFLAAGASTIENRDYSYKYFNFTFKEELRAQAKLSQKINGVSLKASRRCYTFIF